MYGGAVFFDFVLHSNPGYFYRNQLYDVYESYWQQYVQSGKFKHWFVYWFSGGSIKFVLYAMYVNVLLCVEKRYPRFQRKLYRYYFKGMSEYVRQYGMQHQWDRVYICCKIRHKLCV